MTCKINPHILRYIEMAEHGEQAFCKEQKLLAAFVRRVLETEDVYTDDTQLDKYLGLARYFPFEQVFPWEAFCLGLHMCTYRRSDGRPRFPDLFMMIGRGAGKDGYIALTGYAAISPYHGVKQYDVDICANSEEQAMQPFKDCWDVLEDVRYTAKLKRHFYWNRELIQCVKTGSRLKYRTNNPKGKDGLRSGMVVFNEIHQYPDYANINVFTTGLGKKPHPRRLYATTNGEVRDGPLDDMVALSLSVLEGKAPDLGLLPFICRLDSRAEIDDERCWMKANPSLPYLPDLLEEIRKEYREWKQSPNNTTSFVVKRMNLIEGRADLEVTPWENILAACDPLPDDLMGREGILGIDFALIDDMLSVGLRIPYGGRIVWITHSWLCLQSKDLSRLKIPWREWAEKGLLTLVNAPEIDVEAVAEWIDEHYLGRYHVKMLCIDKFRWPLLLRVMGRRGFSFENGNVKFVRPSDQAMVVPVIASAFTNRLFLWGDNPLMRWATNNVKLVSEGVNKSRGNYTYGKIEEKSRKTDPFMALVAACVGAVGEAEQAGSLVDMPGVMTY
jgi:phage terminase large subunit-like protein